MDVRLPDGTIITNVPEGTRQSDLAARVAKMRSPEDPTSAKNLAGAAGEPMLHLATGALATPIAGIAGMLTPVSNALGLTNIPPADAVRKVSSGLTYEPKTTGGKNATEVITYPLEKMGEAANYVGENVSDVTGSPAVGAAANAALQMLVPGAIAKGARAMPATRVAPGLGTIADIAYRAVEPALPSGPADILTRYQRGLAGSAKDRVVAALQAAQELVPGSRPTAGEAIAAIPEASPLAAHQRAISKAPEVSGAFNARASEQAAARSASLDTVGKDKATLEAAEAERAAQAAQNYGEAFAPHGEYTMPGVPKALQANPFFKDALPDANKLAEARGIDPVANPTEFLHLVKLSLDKALTRQGETALSRTEQGAVQSVKDQLVTFLGEKNPAYETARSEFATASRPINQMEVGQYLSDKLNSPLERERPGSFAQAARDAPGTIKRAAGGPRFEELGQVLTPAQEAVVNAIQGDLARKGQFDQLASGTNLTGATTIAGDIHLPNLLSRPAMMVNWLMNTMGHGANPKVNRLAGEQYLDPSKLADSLTRKTAQERIVEELLRLRNPALLGGAAVAGER